MARFRAWIRAADPRIYLVGLFPPLVGAAATLATPAPLPFPMWILVTFAFLCIHAAVNIYNDGFDASTPADQFKTHSLARLASPKSLLVAASAFLLIGCGIGIGLWLRVGGWIVPLLSAIGVALVFVYHAPPFRLSSKGWGEAVTFLGFGVVPVWTAAALGNGSWPPESLVPGILTGWAAALVLFHHNLASIELDELGGKRTFAVRLGARPARQMERFLWVLLVIATLLWEARLASGLAMAMVPCLLVIAVLVGPSGALPRQSRGLVGYAGIGGSVLAALVSL